MIWGTEKSLPSSEVRKKHLLGGRGIWRKTVSVHLESKDVINAQQLEVAVNGPDGATHLILCTGIVELGCLSHETYTLLVGPQLSRRQFVGAIASAAFSSIRHDHKDLARDGVNVELGANLILIEASYDDESSRVKVRAEVSSSIAVKKLAISYNVSILAELPSF